MNKGIKLYIVDIEENLINRLRELFYNNSLGIDVIGYSYNFISTVNDMDSVKNADVVLISAFLPDQMGYDLIPKIKKANKNAKVIMSVDKNTRNLSEFCKEKGAAAVIKKPFKIRAVIEQIVKVYQGEGEEENNEDFFFSADEQQAPEAVEEEKPKRATFENFEPNLLYSSLVDEKNITDKPANIVTFYSTGSTGKSTLLVNVAAAIQKHSQFNPRICILELNYLYPSVLYKFHQDDLISARKNIYDLCESGGDFDDDFFKQSLFTHEPTDIKIIHTPTESNRDPSSLTAENLGHVINKLRTEFDLILIETGIDLKQDSTLFPISISDKTVVVLEPDLANLLHTVSFKNTIEEFSDNMTNFGRNFVFVLNKSNEKKGISAEFLKKQAGIDIKAEIPDDNIVPLLTNNGQFFFESPSRASDNLIELAKMIYPFDDELSLNEGESKNHSKGGLFGSLFKKKK